MLKDKGLVYVFTGDGKGKTSGALGVATRMLLNGNKVFWLSFYKSKDWKISEMKMVNYFSNLEMHWAGKGFFIKDGDTKNMENRVVKTARVNKAIVFDTEDPNEHKRLAREALSLVEQKMRDEKGVGLFVLDEVVQAVLDGLLSVREVVEVCRLRRNSHVILTGRGCPVEIRDMADLVTEMKKVKHPYDLGKLAIMGLDF